MLLFHAAAGGVGLIACQWAKAHRRDDDRNGRVGREGAARPGATAARTSINYRTEDYVARVQGDHRRHGLRRRLRLASARIRFPSSLDCLKPKGLWVTLRQLPRARCRRSISAILSAKGSLYATRPTLMTYTASRARICWPTPRSCSAWWTRARCKIEVEPHLSAARAGAAHRDLEARKTTGSIVLIP